MSTPSPSTTDGQDGQDHSPATLSIDRTDPIREPEYLFQLSPEECLNLFLSRMGPANNFETFRAAVNAANLNDLLVLTKAAYQSFKQNINLDYDNTTIFTKDNISYQVLMNNVPMTIKDWSEFTVKVKSMILVDGQSGFYICQCLNCSPSSVDKIISQHPIVIYNHIVSSAGIKFKCLNCSSIISHERPLSEHQCLIMNDNSSIVLAKS